MCNAKSKVESFEIHLFDRNSFHYRWCSGTAADLQAVDMGSIHVRCINSDDRYKSISFQGKIENYYCVR